MIRVRGTLIIVLRVVLRDFRRDVEDMGSVSSWTMSEEVSTWGRVTTRCLLSGVYLSSSFVSVV